MKSIVNDKPDAPKPVWGIENFDQQLFVRGRVFTKKITKFYFNYECQFRYFNEAYEIEM